MRIISDIESESEIKDADNEENIMKAGSRRWPLHMFYNCFQIWQPSIPGLLYKETSRVNKIRKNFLFQLAEELSSDHHNE